MEQINMLPCPAVGFFLKHNGKRGYGTHDFSNHKSMLQIIYSKNPFIATPVYRNFRLSQLPFIATCLSRLSQ